MARPAATGGRGLAMTGKTVLRDPDPWIVARHEKKIRDRITRHELRLLERFERLLNGNRCPVCGASSKGARIERCRGVCKP
jgi:hypothetical protein